LGGAHGGPVLDPPCETDSEEDDDSDGVHLQTEAVPEDDWEALFSLKKDKIRLKDCVLMWYNA
ncbi:Hypothetical protein FKW44_000486, partial [Caligus rogercresseyi]